MLTVRGPRQIRHGDRVVRRQFLQVGALGLGGLSLPQLLDLQARAEAPARHKAVIMVYVYGGISHLDTYDMKPDAPVEIRGDFKPIRTNVPGLNLCEHFPLQAKVADKLAIVRNWEGRNADGHNPLELLTGVTQGGGRPGFGSVVSRLKGAVREGLPTHVAAPLKTPAGLVKYPTAYLGDGHAPVEPSGALMKNLELALPSERFGDRQALLRSFDTLRRDIDVAGKVNGHDALTERALAMITSSKVRDAFDVSKETPETRARYGESTDWLLARRLVEAGVSCVTLFGHGDWDGHEEGFKVLKRLMPRFDQAVFALVSDLAERGLDQDVAVVVWSEFGRTPKINKTAGRDHWPTGSVLLAGGNFKRGQAIGATDARGSRPTSVPYTAPNVLATLYAHLGIDPTTTLADFAGRPTYLVDDRRLIRELG